ncbi:MAG: hypothetical protein QF412_05970, partial [Planctomycetota bacterium]|nr:hypothetical protein [Planctomycetota bacterium]
MLRLVRWWVVLLGGIFLGAGLFLHGQVAVAFFMRESAQDTFFLWRWVGQITFIFQDETTKAALWMNEIPEEVIRESSWQDRVAQADGLLRASSYRPLDWQLFP